MKALAVHDSVERRYLWNPLLVTHPAYDFGRLEAFLIPARVGSVLSRSGIGYPARKV